MTTIIHLKKEGLTVVIMTYGGGPIHLINIYIHKQAFMIHDAMYIYVYL
jgi:hypothetical protein